MTRGLTGRLTLVAAAGLTVLTAAACSSDRVPASPDPGGARTAVTERQAVQILSSVNAAVVRGIQARDASQFGGRVVGPVREALAAAITVRTTLHQAPGIAPAPTMPRLILTLAGPWPRWFLAAGPSPASATPLLEVLTSPDARSPYGLWGQLNLLPGAVLPELASASVGAPALAPATTGLVATPRDAIARYTDLLNRGQASSYLGQFSADAYRQELTTQLGADRKAFASVGVGEVMSEHTVAPGTVLALPTLDGGALVIGQVDQVDTATVTSGKGSVNLDPGLAALAGRSTISKNLQRHAVEVLALYVPKAGTAGKITLVAASRADVSVSGS